MYVCVCIYIYIYIYIYIWEREKKIFYLFSTVMEALPQMITQHLRWIMQKDLLGQDVFLIGPPGPLRRSVAMQYLVISSITPPPILAQFLQSVTLNYILYHLSSFYFYFSCLLGINKARGGICCPVQRYYWDWSQTAQRDPVWNCLLHRPGK